jgi:hypothetical protein
LGKEYAAKGPDAEPHSDALNLHGILPKSVARITAESQIPIVQRVTAMPRVSYLLER